MMLLTAGTRGDVEPFAALARRAAALGHEVRLGVPDDAGVDLSGTGAVGLDVRFAGLVPGPGTSAPELLRRFRHEVRPAMRRLLAGSVRETLAFAPDVVVHHPLILSAPLVADALGVARVLAELSPVATPSAEVPAAGGPTATRDLGRANRWTYAVPRLAARLLQPEVAHAAGLLPAGPPSQRSPSRATLMAASPQLLPRPSDWPARVHLTGPWHEDDAEAPVEPAVAELLLGGDHLVASFGSMVAGDAERRALAVVAAARAHGLRALLLTGWGGMALPEALRGSSDVLAVRSAPLGPVLRQAEVALHHGGAGTAHAVARAGVPSVVVPFTADQPFWAARLHRMGVAAEPVPARRARDERLARAVEDALGRSRRALEVASAMRQEDGTRDAVEAVVRTVEERRASIREA